MAISARDLARRVAWRARTYSFLDLDRRTSSARFLSGSGRSGTTWLQEMITATGNLRPMFEPFNSRRSTAFSDAPAGTYMGASDQRPVLEESVRRVLTGRYRDPWCDHMNHVSRPTVYHGRVVKEIRATTWLPWLRATFPDVAFAHVIRHPFRVVSSARSLGWSARRLGHMITQEGLVADILGDRVADIDALDSEWERFVAIWCIENLVAFHALSRGAGLLVVYDQVVRDPDKLQDLWDHFAIGGFDRIEVSKPSRLARGKSGSPARAGGQQQDLDLTRDEVRAAVDVLELFGLARFFDGNGESDHGSLHAAWESGTLG